MKKVACFALLSVVLAGCAVNKTPVDTGGSRADGTVKMSFQYGGFERPVVNWAAASATAARRCAAWGYKDASPFGGVIKQCQAFNQYGCIQWFVSRNYQCTGK